MTQAMKQKSIDLSVKSISAEGVIEGYLNTFNHVDLAGDNTQPGAFTKSLKKIKEGSGVLPMLFGHDHTKIAGIWTELYEDEKGLYGKGQINLDTELGRDLLSNIKMGAVKGISIGYFEVDTEYDRKTGALLLKELDLIEASIVLLPCNSQSNVESVKSLFKEGKTVDKVSMEKALRSELGLSRKQAKTLLSQGYTKDFYEDGYVENVDDIYSFIYWDLLQMTPENLRTLIDKINEVIEEVKGEDEEVVEATKEVEQEEENKEKFYQDFSVKANELLELLKK